MKQKIISNIVCDGIKYKGQDGITKVMSGYYQRLYDKVEPEDNEDNFYEKCPKLSKESQDTMEADLTLQELLAGINDLY